MTGALILYSGTFMRYALAVSPKNYLLFGCHFVNFGAQLTQGYRYMQYWKWVAFLFSPPFGLFLFAFCFLFRDIGVGMGYYREGEGKGRFG